MPTTDAAAERHATNSFDRATLLVALELSRSRWLVTSLSPGSAKLSNHMVAGGDGSALLDLLTHLRNKATRRVGMPIDIVVIQEAGLDGFGSIVSWSRTGSRAMSSSPPRSRCPPSSAHQDRCDRWRDAAADACGLQAGRDAGLLDGGATDPGGGGPPPAVTRASDLDQGTGRTRQPHQGLLASQGIRDYRPLRRDCRERLAALHTGDGHLPPRLTAEILRELDRLELVRQQLAEVEAARDALLTSQEGKAPVKLLLRLTGIGPEFATVLWLEGLFRGFSNRRQLAAYAGLAPSPWRSGRIDREQGISKAGNPRLRTTMIELAWLWLRYQPESALSRWFHACKTIVAAFVGLRSSRSRASC